jgi:hypothetical protein
VKNEAEKIELQNEVETFGELVEKGVEIVLLGNCFADFQQGLELPAGRVEGRRTPRFSGRILRFRHENENSIWFGGLTTKGRACGTAGQLRILKAHLPEM